jgi:hypothetical protein
MTREAILEAFQTLMVARCPPPFDDRRGMLATVDAWQRAMDKVPEDLFRAAIDAHVADPLKGRWWPTPAAMLELAERQRRVAAAARPLDQAPSSPCPTFAALPWDVQDQLMRVVEVEFREGMESCEQYADALCCKLEQRALEYNQLVATAEEPPPTQRLRLVKS